MAGKVKANKRRDVAALAALDPDLRWYLDLLNGKSAVWGTTSSTTSTTTTTTT